MRSNLLILFAILICTVSSGVSAFAHPQHLDAPGESTAGAHGSPVVITAQAKTNLGLIVEAAELRAIDNVISVIGQIESIPAKSSAITSRISGRVAAVLAMNGESVKKAAPLVDVESRLVGDPPPHVKYNAPFDGIIIDRHVNQGDTVEPDNHLMEIADLSEVYALGRVYEGQISAIKIGQEVRVLVESFPTQTFSGKIELISGALDAETRTLSIWVRIANPELKLRPNMRATLHIVSGHADSVIAVPRSAVLGDQGNYFVFVQGATDTLSFERKEVVLGIQDDRFTEVIEGVLPGDQVVTAGNYQLQYVNSTKHDPHSHAEAANDSDHAAATSGILTKISLILLGFALCLLGTVVGRRIGKRAG